MKNHETIFNETFVVGGFEYVLTLTKSAINKEIDPKYIENQVKETFDKITYSTPSIERGKEILMNCADDTHKLKAARYFAEIVSYGSSGVSLPILASTFRVSMYDVERKLLVLHENNVVVKLRTFTGGKQKISYYLYEKRPEINFVDMKNNVRKTKADFISANGEINSDLIQKFPLDDPSC